MSELKDREIDAIVAKGVMELKTRFLKNPCTMQDEVLIEWEPWPDILSDRGCE